MTVAFRLIILSIIVLLAGAAAYGQLSTVYVDATYGSDIFTGANPTNTPSGTGPKSTIHKALGAVANNGTIVIFAGIYAGDGVDTDGLPGNPTDNADIEISSAKYPNITTGLTIELRSLGTKNEIRIEAEANSVLARNGALVTHTADGYIPNLVVNLPNGTAKIVTTNGTEYLNLPQQHSTGTPTSGVILKAGSLNLPNGSFVRLRSGASIAMYGAASFLDKAPTKGANLNLSYFGDENITAGPEARYGNYGSGVLSISKTSGTTVTFTDSLSFDGITVPTGGIVGLVPNKAITVSSGSALFDNALSLGNVGSAGTSPSVADVLLTGAGSATFNGQVTLVVGAAAMFSDHSMSSVENTGTGTATFNAPVTWNAAWNAAGTPLAGLTFVPGSGTALVRNASTGTIRFKSTVTLATNTITAPTGDAYFSVVVQNDWSGTLSFDQGVTAPNSAGTLSGNRNFTMHALNALTGVLDISGTIRGNLSNTGPAGGTININGPTIVSLRIVNVSGKIIALGSNTLTLARVVGPPYLNDGAGGLITPSPMNHFTNGGSITATTGTLLMGHSLGIATFNGGIFSSLTCDGIGGTTQLVGTGSAIDNLYITGGTLNALVGVSVTNAVSLSDGLLTIGDGMTLQASAFIQSRGTCLVGGGSSGDLRIFGDFISTGGTFTAGVGSLLEIAGPGGQRALNAGSQFQVYDVLFSNPGSTINFGQSVRVSHSVNITPGTTLSLSTNDLIVNGDNATVTNAGSILGNGGALIFGGAATVPGGRPVQGAVLNSTGPATYSTLRVDVGVGNRLRSNGPVRFSRLLELTSGALEIMSGDVSPSASGVRIVHNVVSSPDIILSGGIFNASNVSYDLEYNGTLNSTIAPGVDLSTNVRNWTVNVNSDPNADGDNDVTTGNIYYIQVPGTTDLTCSGVLTIGPVAGVRIASGPARVSFVLSASNVTHTVRGILTTVDPEDNISIMGSGVTILGGAASTDAALLGNTAVNSAGTCTFRNIQGFTGGFTANAGSVVILGMGSSNAPPAKLASEQIIAGPLTLNGSSFTLGSNVEVHGGIALNVGTLNSDVYNLTLALDGDFVQSQNADGYSSNGGYLVMNRSNASLRIGNITSTGLPNLRVLAPITLAAPGRINGNLEIGIPASSGIPRVRLGAAGNDLTVAGSAITLSSDGTGNTAAIVADGTSNGTPGGKLIIVNRSASIIANGDFSIEELTYNPVGGAGTLNIVSTSSSSRTLTINDIFTQVAGDLNLGSNYLSLLGTGTGSGARAYNRTAGGILASTGVVRFEGVGAQQFGVGPNLSVPNLKINNAAGVSLFPAAQSLTVSGTLDLGKGPFVVNQGTLILSDGATIIRRQTGSFISSVPTFGNSVYLWYLVDQSNGTLVTQNELPAGSTVLRNLHINNPSSSVGSAGVVLGRNAIVRDTLFLEAGALVKGSFDVTIGGGGTIQMSGGTFDSTGTRGGAPIVSSYNLIYRTGSTVTSTARELQIGAGVAPASLSVFSKPDGTPTSLVLHASCTIGDLMINSDGGGLVLAPAGSRATRILTITGNVNVIAGAFLSSTGIATLIDLAGTVQQTISVPSSGLLLQGGISSISLRLNNPNGFVLQGGNLTLSQGAVLFFLDGVLRTGSNAVVLSQTSGGQGFDHSGVVRPNISHVFGRVRHSVVGGAGSPTVSPNGRYEFPVGTATKYRPFAVIFRSSYPAINATTVDLEHQEGNPGGSAGFPLDGGNGVRVGNFAPFSWVVTTGAAGFAADQAYDVEVQTPDKGAQAVSVQDLRIVRRQEAGGVSNAWSLQGSGSSYYGNDILVPSAGDTTYVVRTAFSSGTLNAQGVRFAIGLPTRPPVFLNVLPDTVVAEGQNLTFSYIADPMDLGETIQYTLINPPTGAMINPSTGTFLWRPSYGQAGSYSIVASAYDGQFLTIATATVTVRRVNRPPSFTNVLRDTTIRDTRDTLRFTYTAADPEGDPLLFSLVSGPPGLTLGNAGVLRWGPTAQQANQSYLVKVMVSDGISSDSTSAMVTVTRNRVRGDVDGDGLITANDASLVLRHVVGLIVLTDPAALYAADASADGLITAFDASMILQASIGWIIIPSYSVQGPAQWTGPYQTTDDRTLNASLSWSAVDAGRAHSELRVSLRASSQRSDIYAVQWHIQGDFVRYPVKGVAASVPEGWQILYKQTDQDLMIAAVGPTPISGRELGTVTFRSTSEEDCLTLNGSGFINEMPQTLGQLEVAAVPSEFALRQNYPNPFNPGTTIKYLISEKCRVSLVIYNMQGQKIRTLVDAASDPGSFTVGWDGRNDHGELVSSGPYIYRLNAGIFVSSRRMILLR